MLTHMHGFSFVLTAGNSFLSISILIISRSEVTRIVVSNRHRHYSLTAGSVVLHVIVVFITFVCHVTINISRLTNVC